MATIDTGDTAWILTSSALVFLMTPGLGMFYGGLVGSTNVLNTIMMSLACGAIVMLQWLIVGYSFALGPGSQGFGNFEKAGLMHVGFEPNPLYAATIPEYIYVTYQMTFAVITPALISGAVAARLRFRAWIIFTIIWTTVVYDLIAHWVWAAWEETDENGNVEVKFGWLRALGALDFAGGTVVHIASGFSALAASIIVGKRKSAEEMHKPHNVPLTIIGASLLWFGWFGFNGGSALGANGIAALSILNTNIAAAAAFLTWMLLDSIFVRTVSVVGATIGAVVGLVSITPACGFVHPASSIAFGVIGAICSYFAIKLKEKLRYDDLLDVFACHGMGGVVGAILTGCFAQASLNPAGADGLFFGNPRLLGVQILAVVVTALASVILTSLILVILKYTPFMGLRPSDDNEMLGMDLVSHKEYSYRLLPLPGEEEKAVKQVSKKSSVDGQPIELSTV